MIPTVEGVESEVVRVGSPYHGVYSIGKIYLTGGGIKETGPSGPNGGKTLVSRNPYRKSVEPISPEDAALDAADGREWRDYTLLSGSFGWVAGESIAPFGGGWIYYDTEGTPWAIRAYASPTGDVNVIKFAVVLQGIVGRFQEPMLTNVSKELLSVDITRQSPPVYPNFTTGMSDAVNDNFMMQPSEAGNKAFVNLYMDSTPASTDHNFSTEIRYYGRYESGSYGYRTIRLTLDSTYLVELDGVGSVLQGSLGEGITASIVQDKTYGELHSSESSGGSSSYSSGGGWEYTPSGIATLNYDSGQSTSSEASISITMARIFVGDSPSSIELETHATYTMEKINNASASARFTKLSGGGWIWVITSVNGIYQKTEITTNSRTLKCGASTYAYTHIYTKENSAVFEEDTTPSSYIPPGMVKWTFNPQVTSESGTSLNTVILVHSNTVHAQHGTAFSGTTYSLYGTYGHTKSSEDPYWEGFVYAGDDVLYDFTYQPVLGEFTESRRFGSYPSQIGACYV